MNLPEMQLILLGGAVGLVLIGIAGLTASNHLYRMLLALGIAEAGANLLLVLTGYRPDAAAPILLAGQAAGTPMVDPVPQALVLTAIVIGVGVQALGVALVMRVYRHYGTLDMRKLRERMEAELCDDFGIAAAASSQAPAGERPLPPAGTREQGGRP